MDTAISTNEVLTVGATLLALAVCIAAWVYWRRKRFEEFIKNYLDDLYVRHMKKEDILLHPTILDVESEHFLHFFCVTVHFEIFEFVTPKSPEFEPLKSNSQPGREFVYTFNNTRSILDSASDFEIYIAENHRTLDEVIAENQAWWDRVT